MDWLDLLAVQRTLKSLLQHHNLEASGIMNFTLFLPPPLKSELPPSPQIHSAQFQAFTRGFPVGCLSGRVWRRWSLGVGSPGPQDGLALWVGTACPGVGLGGGWCSGAPGTFQQHHLVSQGRSHVLCSVMVTLSADLGVFWKMKPSISHSSFRVKGGYSFQSQGSCSVMILPKPRSSHELSPHD